MGIDTHKAVKTLTGVGFSETQAEALIETMGETDDALATKADVQELARSTSAEFATVRAEFRTELKDLELRLEQRLNRQTIQLAGLAIAAGGVAVAILKWFP